MKKKKPKMHLQGVSLSSLSIEASICTRLSSYLSLNKTCLVTALGQASHQGYLRKTVTGQKVLDLGPGKRKKREIWGVGGEDRP